MHHICSLWEDNCIPALQLWQVRKSAQFYSDKEIFFVCVCFTLHRSYLQNESVVCTQCDPSSRNTTFLIRCLGWCFSSCLMERQSVLQPQLTPNVNQSLGVDLKWQRRVCHLSCSFFSVWRTKCCHLRWPQQLSRPEAIESDGTM